MALRLSAVLLLAVLSVQAADAKPNIAFFLADDPGQRDLGCSGSTFSVE